MNKNKLESIIKNLEVDQTITLYSNNGFGYGIKRVELFDNTDLLAVGLWDGIPKVFTYDYCMINQSFVIDEIVKFMSEQEEGFMEGVFELEGCRIESVE